MPGDCLSSTTNPFSCSSNLAILAIRTSFAPCLKDPKHFFCFSHCSPASQVCSVLSLSTSSARQLLVPFQFKRADFPGFAILQISHLLLGHSTQTIEPLSNLDRPHRQDCGCKSLLAISESKRHHSPLALDLSRTAGGRGQSPLCSSELRHFKEPAHPTRSQNHRQISPKYTAESSGPSRSSSSSISNHHAVILDQVLLP